MTTWQYEPHLNFWRGEFGPTCNAINGTDGGIFPPSLQKHSTLDLFVTDICRSIVVEHIGEAEHRGIAGYRYEVAPHVLHGYERNPDNRCFCLSQDDQQCFGDGLLELNTCMGKNYRFHIERETFLALSFFLSFHYTFSQSYPPARECKERKEMEREAKVLRAKETQ